MTIAELYEPAMEIETQAEADAYLEKCVRHSLSDDPTQTRKQAEAIQRSNLGYYAGYYSDETRERVERLFRCSHPILGSISWKGPPTPEEAFERGRKLGEENKTRRPL